MRSQRATALVLCLLLTNCGGGGGGGGGTAEPKGDKGDSGDGGKVVTLLTPEGTATPAELQASVEILRDRLDAAGEKDATVEVKGDRIEITSAEDVDDVVREPRLEFRRVVASALSAPGTKTAVGQASTIDDFGLLSCLDAEVSLDDLGEPSDEIAACDPDGFMKFHLAPAKVVGRDVMSAKPSTEQGRVHVTVGFTPAGQTAWTALTKEAAGQRFPTNQIAFVLDGLVYAAPQIQSAFTDGIKLAGAFSDKQAKLLESTLAFGGLPLMFTISEG